MKPPGLEELREMLSDDRLLVSLATVESLELANDKSVLRVTVTVVPDNIEMVCRMTWESVGPDAGFFQFPNKGDLVLVGFVDGHEDEAFVLKRLTSQADKIPDQAITGDSVLRALAGKKAHLISDTEILLGRGAGDPAERIVLGDTFKDAYSDHLGVDAAHTHIGNLGYATSVPLQAQDYLDIKADPVDNEDMLSDLSKTEK